MRSSHRGPQARFTGAAVAAVGYRPSRDPGPGRQPAAAVRADPSTDAETGRGLLLVEMITDQWGAYPTPPYGKSVWALVANP